MKTNVIHIEITGPVQTGKSAIAASIKAMLDSHGYCVARPNREDRNNPPREIALAGAYEKPMKDTTVIIISEHLTENSNVAK